MSQSAPANHNSLIERLRAGMPRRVTGIVVALVLEAILLLLLYTLGQSGEREETQGETLTTFDAGSAEEEAPAEREQAEEAKPTPQKPSETSQQQPQPDQPQIAPPAPDKPAFALIPMARDQMARADISNLPKRPSPPADAPMMGPANTSRTSGDSQRVGTAPNGQPLYAAAWYREPSDGEMRGYLSTASGPGWGLIACKTVSDWRVEDCVALDEFPTGSNIARSALAAAWQFQVRPPRLGGKYKVGEWVRIRIKLTNEAQ